MMNSLNPVRHLCCKVFRTKTVTGEFMDTALKRCLSTFDITLLGVGYMMGAGIYVLTGAVARNIAGPAIIISFILAGIASLLSALCYAEFGARVPKAGSAYTYTYVTVGELWAFVIGWNIILEHMLGAAAVARSWSGYLDSMLGHVIRNNTINYVGEMEGVILGDYPDFIAFLVVVAVCFFMGCGAKASTNFNTIFTVINVLVISFVTIYGFTFADIKNWTAGDGFMPYTFAGVISGAASCFFAYIGFDGIATSGEEASNPSKSIPRATLISMSVVTLCYVLMSAALTLMIPYSSIHPTAAFADAFEQHGATWAKYVVAVGALSGMTTSLVGSLFALPRCVYAMASDGLIFRWLAHVHGKTQVPTLATIVFGAVTAIIALLFDIETLVEFLSIGTLLAYTIVSCSVIILRYQKPLHVTTLSKGKLEGDTAVPEDKETGIHRSPLAEHAPDLGNMDESDTMGLVDGSATAGTLKVWCQFLIPVVGNRQPGVLVCAAVFIMSLSMFGIGVITNYGHVNKGNWISILFLVLLGLLTLISFLLICAHEQSTAGLRFKVPLVPLVPSLSIFINIIFMMHLAPVTWLRLLIWLIVGLLVYFLYGVKHSSENAVLQREYSSLITASAVASAAPTPTLETNASAASLASADGTSQKS